MNLIKHHIVRIYSVDAVPHSRCVRADMLVNSGAGNRREDMMFKDMLEFERVKQDGFYRGL